MNGSCLSRIPGGVATPARGRRIASMAKKISVDELRRLLIECEDITTDASVQADVRKMRRRLDELKPGKQLNSLYQEAERLREALREGKTYEIKWEIESAQKAAVAAREGAKRGGIMALFGKLKDWNKQRKDPTGTKIAAEQQKAESNIHTLEQQIVHMSEQRAALMGKLKEMAAKCAGESKDSPMYTALRARATALQPQIQRLEKQIMQYTRALQQNAQYQAMLEAGKINIDLGNYIPDISEAEALMGTINAQAQEVSSSLDMFGSSVKDSQREFDQTFLGTDPTESSMFDELVDEANAAAKSGNSGSETESAGKASSDPDDVLKELGIDLPPM